MDHPQRIALFVLWVCIITVKIIAVSPATQTVITFRDRIVINATQVVWLVMGHPQQTALPAILVRIIIAQIIAV